MKKLPPLTYTRMVDSVLIVADELDREVPGWEWLIDLDRLDMVNSKDWCIGAQLGWPPVSKRSDIDSTNIAFGFRADALRNSNRLHRLWLHVIKQRLTKNNKWWNLSTWVWAFTLASYINKIRV